MAFRTLNEEDVTADRLVAGDLVYGLLHASGMCVVNVITDMSQQVMICYQIVEGINKGVKRNIVFQKSDVVHRYVL